MMLVDVQIALNVNIDINVAMSRKLIEHVIEETKPGVDG